MCTKNREERTKNDEAFVNKSIGCLKQNKGKGNYFASFLISY